MPLPLQYQTPSASNLQRASSVKLHSTAHAASRHSFLLLRQLARMVLKNETRRVVLLALSVPVGVARGELPDYPMTMTEMKIATGYYTESGKYLGGIPKAEDVSREIYQCVDDDFFYTTVNDTDNNATATTTAEYATVCMEWRADESAEGTFQLGSCECEAVENEAYCSAWTCVQVKEIENCNSGDCYISTNTDAVLCQCDVENASGLYCDSWSCKQIDSEGRQEFEEYHCQRESASGHFCEAWNGNVTAQDEIEVVRCECVAMWDGDRVCSYWECEEIGLATCGSVRGSWCNLGVSVGVGGVFGSLGILGVWAGLLASAKRDRCQLSSWVLVCCIMGVAWCMLWSSGVVIWGGVDGATIVGILWGTGLLVAVASAYFQGRRKQ
ncbi:unnamed protein product [Scytosiphon promiscuus]